MDTYKNRHSSKLFYGKGFYRMRYRLSKEERIGALSQEHEKSTVKGCLKSENKASKKGDWFSCQASY